MRLIVSDERHDESFQKCIEKLRNRRFVVVSIDDDGNFQEHWHKMGEQEALLGIELLKLSILGVFEE